MSFFPPSTRGSRTLDGSRWSRAARAGAWGRRRSEPTARPPAERERTAQIAGAPPPSELGICPPTQPYKKGRESSRAGRPSLLPSPSSSLPTRPPALPFGPSSQLSSTHSNPTSVRLPAQQQQPSLTPFISTDPRRERESAIAGPLLPLRSSSSSSPPTIVFRSKRNGRPSSSSDRRCRPQDGPQGRQRRGPAV